MDYDLARLEARFDNLPVVPRIFFALLAAERLRACCWAFAKSHNIEVSLYYAGCDLVFDHVIGDSKTSVERLEETTRFLDAIVPKSEDYGDCLATQAQEGLAALLCSMELWMVTAWGAHANRGDPVEGFYASSAVVNAIEHFDLFASESVHYPGRESDSSLLLDREIKWQSQLIDILEDQMVPRTKAPELRLLNRSFMVPPAV